jgi:Ca2+:H+ antiporter
MAHLIHHWTTLAPFTAAALLVLTTVIGEQSWLLVGCVATLPAAVLALTVTVIEAALLLSLLVAAGAGMETLPRDTVYATVMIITTGVVGLCTMIGGLTHREQLFRVDGAGGGLAALIVLAVVALVLPDFTITTGVGTYSRGQSLFVAVVSAMLWGIFAFVQTIRHRDYFLPHDDHARPDEHALPPSRWQTTLSLVLLLVALVAVVGLAKVLSHPLGEFVEAFHLPRSVVGIAVAMVVLLPETWAAIRAAYANRLQSSKNLAIGSALATIGLTVPVVVFFATAYGLPLVLGLDPKDVVLLVTPLLVSVVTLGTGRTSMMQGAVHLVLFAT